MRLDQRRALLLDVPLALGVTLLSWTAAGYVSMTGRYEVERWPRGLGPDAPMGPGYHGPDPSGFSWAAFSWVLYPCLVLLVAGLALRRVWPRATFVVVVVAVGGYLAAGGPSGPVLLAPALSLHALALALPIQRWSPMTPLLVPMMAAGSWDQPYLGLTDPAFYGGLVTGFTLMLVPAMLGLLWRSRRESERQQREQELRRYAYEERLQIARDVHDVVGHSLSVINLQAGVALHVLAKRPDEVQTSLEAIKRTSREALAELRTTLAVYRNPSSDEPRAPQPGLDRLDDLVGALRAAGREVSVAGHGDVAAPFLVSGLPAAVDQAAYRIVQEALTNVVRHADGARASVLIHRTPYSLGVEISDVASRPLPPMVEGSGIAGMRERATAVGGVLTVTQGAGGEFRVRAELPLAGEVPAQ